MEGDMKKILLFSIACVLLLSVKLEFAQPQKALPSQNLNLATAKAPRVVPEFGNVPLYFIPNQGQVDERALYYAKASGYTLWLTKEGLIFDSFRKKETKRGPEAVFPQPERELGKLERDFSRLEFLNANEKAEVVPLDRTEHRVNYFIGNNPEKWKTDIETSKAVLYRGIYENIDLKVYGVEKQIEYDWVVKPGGDVADIKFSYRDVRGVKAEGGDLVIETEFGELRHSRPIAYQEINGQKVEVEAEFKEAGDEVYGFAVAAYDKAHELIIDPMILVYSTYLGGSGYEYGYGVAVDSSGCAHVTGYTTSLNFPVVNAYASTGSGHDAFVTKFAADGSSLIYSTYIGGTGEDESYAITIGGQVAFITGRTESDDFPMDDYVDSTFEDTSEAFVVMLNYSGNDLLLSTYLGGDGSQEAGYSIYAASIRVDAFHRNYYDIYVAGRTNSTANFPLQSAYDSTYGGMDDAFVTKISYYMVLGIGEVDAASIVYSTYLGGGAFDLGTGIDVDADGYAYVTGLTQSTDFPTKYGLSKEGPQDIFVTQFSPDGSALEWSTYLGGSSMDYGRNIAIASSGGVIVSGYTSSSDFPMYNSYDSSHNGNYDIFLAKVGHKIRFRAGRIEHYTGIDFSTYLGGGSNDQMEFGCSMALDRDGDIYLTGFTISADFPLVRAFDSSGNGWDAFVAIFHFGTALELRYSSFLGGGSSDRGFGIAVDASKDAYIVGNTTSGSESFPLRNAYQGTLRGLYDAFLTKVLGPRIHADFNSDGQEDILWRYYGSGGSNLVWYMGYLGNSLARLEGSIMDRPSGEFKTINMLHGQGPKQTFVDPREPGLMGSEKPAQRVFRDPREAGGLMTGENPLTQRGVPTMRDPGEMGVAGVNGVPVMRVTGATWIGNGWLPAVPDTSWEIGGTGDFNADGKVDILWRDYSLGYNVIWYMDGVTWIDNGWLPAVTDAAWRIEGTGDFNADGKVDILWRDYNLGYNVVWYMDGVTWIDNGWLPAVTDTNWKIAGTGDFNGDGKVDILWRYYGASGYDLVWYMDGVTWIDNGWLPAVTDTNWKIEGTGDLDGNGKVDILWRDYSLGYNVIWYMDGVTWIDNGWLPTEPDINWRIENH
jgi:hypothetical protein